MTARIRRPAYSSLLATVAALALVSSAHAGLVEIPTNPSPGPIGEMDVFGITGASASFNGNVLTITVNTWFAGAPGVGGGSAPSYGTGYGSLFLASNTFNSTTAEPFNYAVTTPYGNAANPVSTNSASPTTTGLYATGTYSLPSNLQNQLVTTSKGQIVGSNINGITPGSYTWGNGIVQYTPGLTQTTSELASVYVTPDGGPTSGQFPLGNIEGSITYTIVDSLGLFSNGSIGLYWAMTCANQAITGTITPTPLGGGNQGSTPLPAALPLFVSGLGMVGFFGSRRKKRAQAIAV